jgi:hypothetical protein
LRQLLENGADVNAANIEGTTALILSAGEGSLATVEVLLEHGADVDVIDEDGDTALKVAKEFDHEEIVLALRNARASGSAKGQEQKKGEGR